MNLTDNLTTLSQAYLLLGHNKSIEDNLVDTLLNLHGVISVQNPDFWMKRFETFNIEDARELRTEVLRRKVSKGKRVFMLSANNFTREASNALLKTLEEPQQDTHFFIILPNASRVLPTILSRVQVIQTDFINESQLSPKEFYVLTQGERITFIKDTLVKVEKESISKTEIQTFIENLIRYRREVAKSPKEISRLALPADVAGYRFDQSASLKMILEYLAIF